MDASRRLPATRPPGRYGRLGPANSRIVCVTGLPCIGKTHALQPLCRRLGLRLVQFDEVRNACMPRAGSDLAADGSGGRFAGFPLDASEWRALLASTETFLAFHAWQARRFGDALRGALDGDGPVVCEISPFVLPGLDLDARILSCGIERPLHVERLRSRLGCPHDDARAIQGFFTRALADAGDRPRGSRAIDIHALPSELARLGGGLCGA